VGGASLEQRPDKNWFLTGDVTLETIPELLKACAAPAGTVDLAEVKRIDSAAIALLLEWQRLAHGRAAEVRFRNVPKQVLAIAGVCGVRPLLSLED
jgi:phospholipid transport system transporter-binding protein